MKRASERLKAWVMQKEEFREKAYRDVAGVLTIGWGHTGPDVHEIMVIGRDEGYRLLTADFEKAEREVDRLCGHLPLTQGMADCLISFEFNSGGLEYRDKQGRPVQSAALRALLEHRWADAGEELVHWNWSGGKERRGLLERRCLEVGLFFCAEPWPA